ncbi:hypothetical protein F4782DRAFT_550233 [Xylaria castorea]|nr:hypothetical protein F4782DRAFT_550233 [Xylaria castorea]
MATGMSPEQAPASNTNEPKELYIHSGEVFRPSNIISSIQVENGRIPVKDTYHSYHYQHHHNMPAQNNWNTYGHNTIPYPRPFTQPSLPLLRASIPTQAPTRALPTPGIAGPSIPLGYQYQYAPTPNRAPSTIAFQAQQISKNYRGNHLAERNQSANIPLEQSTSVWITNLPPDCNYATLLGVVRDTGKVYATVINPPKHEIMTSAAKIVFFDVEGRQRFEARANAGQFAVGAYVPRVQPNRILTEARPPGPESRILFITGPARADIQEVLCNYFQRWCAFDLEYVQHLPLGDGDGNVTMVWAFGSYRCQAERIFTTIREIKACNLHSPIRDFWDSIAVCYGRDPCDR